MKKEIKKGNKEKDIKKAENSGIGNDLEDCLSVMNPEMARNYEKDDPCNDGTKTKREKP